MSSMNQIPETPRKSPRHAKTPSDSSTLPSVDMNKDSQNNENENDSSKSDLEEEPKAPSPSSKTCSVEVYASDDP